MEIERARGELNEIATAYNAELEVLADSLGRLTSLHARLTEMGSIADHYGALNFAESVINTESGLTGVLHLVSHTRTLVERIEHNL